MAPHRRRKSGSVGRDSEDEDDQLHSLISGLERPPSVEEDADKGAANVKQSELEPEEEEFLPTVTSADPRVGEERLSPADSPKRRGEWGFSLLVVCETTSQEQTSPRILDNPWIYQHTVTPFTVTV